MDEESNNGDENDGADDDTHDDCRVVFAARIRWRRSRRRGSRGRSALQPIRPLHAGAGGGTHAGRTERMCVLVCDGGSKRAGEKWGWGTIGGLTAYTAG